MYDFTTQPDRSPSGSHKWRDVPAGLVPLSVADMEFVTAPEIREALIDCAATEVLGYTGPTEAYTQAVCRWMRERHSLRIQPEWIVSTPGVVYALGQLIEALTAPQDKVLILPPVYYPFARSITARGRRVSRCPLVIRNGRYKMDFAALEEAAADPDCTMLLFCSPHNPVGRVWSREELERVAAICERHGLFILSDEIHNDLILPGHVHTPMLSVSDYAREHGALCTAPSKTFNLAGVQCSNILIPNPEARKKFQTALQNDLCSGLNIFAYRACTAAYTQCGPWLDELLPVIAKNARLVEEFLARRLPAARVFPLEGTYLLWVDFRCLGLSNDEREAFMKEEAGLYLDEGVLFGDEGSGFERFNLACPAATLQRALERLDAALTRRGF